jgi:hypothetical protein
MTFSALCMFTIIHPKKKNLMTCSKNKIGMKNADGLSEIGTGIKKYLPSKKPKHITSRVVTLLSLIK